MGSAGPSMGSVEPATAPGARHGTPHGTVCGALYRAQSERLGITSQNRPWTAFRPFHRSGRRFTDGVCAAPAPAGRCSEHTPEGDGQERKYKRTDGERTDRSRVSPSCMMMFDLCARRLQHIISGPCLLWTPWFRVAWEGPPHYRGGVVFARMPTPLYVLSRVGGSWCGSLPDRAVDPWARVGRQLGTISMKIRAGRSPPKGGRSSPQSGRASLPSGAQRHLCDKGVAGLLPGDVGRRLGGAGSWCGANAGVDAPARPRRTLAASGQSGHFAQLQADSPNWPGVDQTWPAFAQMRLEFDQLGLETAPIRPTLARERSIAAPNSTKFGLAYGLDRGRPDAETPGGSTSRLLERLSGTLPARLCSCGGGVGTWPIRQCSDHPRGRNTAMSNRPAARFCGDPPRRTSVPLFRPPSPSSSGFSEELAPAQGPSRAPWRSPSRGLRLPLRERGPRRQSGRGGRGGGAAVSARRLRVERAARGAAAEVLAAAGDSARLVHAARAAGTSGGGGGGGDPVLAPAPSRAAQGALAGGRREHWRRAGRDVYGEPVGLRGCQGPSITVGGCVRPEAVCA